MSRRRKSIVPLGAFTPLLAMLVVACSPARYPAPVTRGDNAARRVPPTTVSSAPVDPGAIVVSKGDSLYRISRRFKVALRDLIAVNGIRPPYQILPGQQLRLPTSRLHIVRAGETLYGISHRYRVDAHSLVRANGILPPYRVVVGQRLRLPKVSTPSPRPVAAPPKPKRIVASTSRRTRRTTIKPIPAVAAAPSRASVALGRPPARAGKGFLWPVRGRVAVGYGPRGKGLHNDGINILAPRGAPVRAADNGIVAYSGNELRGFGNLVLIKHAGGWISAYAHAERILVRAGQRVRRGQRIARVGNSGSVVRPQLHFELRRGRRAVNPVKFLSRGRAVGFLSPASFQVARPNPG